MITITTKNGKKYLNNEEIEIGTLYDGQYCCGVEWVNKAGEVVLVEKNEWDPICVEELEARTKELADLMHDDYI